MPQILHLLGSGRYLGGLLLRPGLQHLLLLEEGLQLGLSVLKFSLSAGELGDGQVTVAAGTVM
jgi:hypothetical protein